MQSLALAGIKVTAVILLVSLGAQAGAVGCWYPDREVSRVPLYERQPCTAAAYCYKWGVNPATGQYEYYYGYHPDCPGFQDRQSWQITCQREDGGTYITREDGYWGICQAN